ncbi:NYN domain-containing protein [Fodinicola acaciae]|uniref:NYN domain-containing protein n=1 Tax=Fodinicola acaciae TaxID=2681555 RepID=UPI0013D0B124|nr:NYN domain-containing protein [Fodinicola acaciae]
MAHILIVDGANVVGSRPDGWWRDRLGAARRLRAELDEWHAGQPPDSIDVILVVEGRARPLATEDATGVRVVAAPGEGDDTIVEQARDAARNAQTTVITADRALRERVRAVGAQTESPRWLWSLLGNE